MTLNGQHVTRDSWRNDDFFLSGSIVARFTNIICGKLENSGFELRLYKLSLIATN